MQFLCRSSKCLFLVKLEFWKTLINSFNCGFLVLLIHCSEFPFKREQTFMSLYLKCEAGLKNKNMFIYTHVYDTQNAPLRYHFSQRSVQQKTSLLDLFLNCLFSTWKMRNTGISYFHTQMYNNDMKCELSITPVQFQYFSIQHNLRLNFQKGQLE